MSVVRWYVRVFGTVRYGTVRYVVVCYEVLRDCFVLFFIFYFSSYRKGTSTVVSSLDSHFLCECVCSMKGFC